MNRAIRIAVIVLLLLVVAGIIHHHRRQRLNFRPEPNPAQQETQETSFGSGDYQGSMVTADGLSRSYLFHLPSGFSGAKSYPLVFVFHGGMGTGARMEKGTNFDAKADANGFIVVYPDGVDHNWNDGRGTTGSNIDDVGFVRQLIVKLESRLPINAKRIYATGPSNGGMFSQRLGCDLADVLAAIGPDAGPMPADLLPACKPARPIAVVGIQGGADPLVPIDGGEVKSLRLIGIGKGGMVESAATTMKFWASANGCNSDPVLVHQPPAVNDGTSVDQYSYSGCASGAPVVYYIVQGMGHVWPPHAAILPSISGATSGNIDATDTMWDFFSKISR